MNSPSQPGRQHDRGHLGGRRTPASRGRSRSERERAEQLLLNILPVTVAQRLRRGEGLIADHYTGSDCPLFADIVDFTRLSANIAPEAVVSYLNVIFSEFDQLAQDLGLEKIKTIGDAYMVVGRVPTPGWITPKRSSRWLSRCWKLVAAESRHGNAFYHADRHQYRSSRRRRHWHQEIHL